MNDSSSASTENKQTEKKFYLEAGELRSGSYWLSMVAMVIATVIGVFLAATEGYNQAIKFENNTEMEDNYHLRSSLHDELADNVAAVNGLIDVLSKPQHYRPEFDRPKLSRYVWETMRFSKYTMEVPSEFLTGARRFYQKIDFLLDQLDNNRLGKRVVMERLQSEVNEVDKKLLPGLRENIAGLRNALKGTGLDID